LLQYRQWAGRFDLIEYPIDGYLLERWFLKTMVNLEVVGKQEIAIGQGASEPGRPSMGLVEIAFGRKRFEGRAGLYCLGQVGDTVDLGEHLRYVPWIQDSDRASTLIGGEFWFYGIGFLLWLREDVAPAIESGETKGSLLHRPLALDFQLDGKPSQRINFKW
jgi:hypothetical protein